MGKTVVATIAAASILLGGVVSASAAEPAPTGGETNGGCLLYTSPSPRD